MNTCEDCVLLRERLAKALAAARSLRGWLVDALNGVELPDDAMCQTAWLDEGEGKP